MPYDLPISVSFPSGEVIDAGINLRPYVYECLKKASQLYQVVIFTASHKSYADEVLNVLEAEFSKEIYLTPEEEKEIKSQARDENERKRLIKNLKMK